MINWLTRIGFWAVIVANWRLLIKLVFIVLCYFISESLFSRWLDPTLDFQQNTRFTILVMNTIVTILLFIWFLLSIKNILWINKAKKAIEVDKSFKAAPENYTALEDVRKTPKLKNDE
tara:strand:+ start:1221 stop:1574 length:354 start_codon:yes stop_codon:yes gene_type:complete